MNAPITTPKLSHNVTRISHLDLPGAGQVYVQGNYAYVGHITNNQQLGTSIVDVADPKNPKLLRVVEDRHPAFTAEIVELTDSTLRVEQKLTRQSEIREITFTGVEGETVCPDWRKN